MTLIIAFLSAHVGAILAALGAGASLIFAFFRNQQAKAATAQAQAAIAQAGEAQAKSDASAQARVAEVVQNEQKAAQTAAKVPDADVDAELKKLGGMRD